MTYHVKLDQMLKPMSEPPENDRRVLAYWISRPNSYADQVVFAGGKWWDYRDVHESKQELVAVHRYSGWSELPAIEEVEE